MKKQTSIDKILHARSIAIIGASNKAGSVGNEVVKRLVSSGFTGRIYPVNLHEEKIEGIRCFKSVMDVQKPIDVAVIAVPNTGVIRVVEECHIAKISNVVVLSAGFKEVGGDNAILEQRLLDAINHHKMHMIGPNCLGFANLTENMNATFMPVNVSHAGKIGFVSQSGALISGIVNLLQNKNYGFSQVVSVGNQADIDTLDIIEYWENDDTVKIIMVYAENIKDLARFKEVCERVGQKKPIVFLKSGRSAKGQAATASHTGALADDETSLQTVFDSAGVIRELYLRDFLNTVQAFNHCNMPKGNNLAILTNAGGPGIIATDTANDVGLPLAELSESTKNKLLEIVPSHASVKNPVDIIASASLEQFYKSAEVLLESPEVDILLVIYLYITVKNDVELIESLNILKQKYPNKSIVTIFQTNDEFFEKLGRHPEITVPVYNYAVDAVKAVKRLTQRKDFLQKRGVVAKNLPVNRDDVRKIITKYKLKDLKILSTQKSLEVLSAYGLPVAPYGFAKSLAQAKKIAREIGYPIVLKISSTVITHKTEVGGVVVGIKDEAELKRKWEILMNNLLLHDAHEGLEGIVVMKQIVDADRQFTVGTIKKKGVGNTLMFGLGGIFVEAMQEVTFTTCPINLLGLEKLLSSNKATKLMEANRGFKAVDKQRLAEIFIRVSQLVEDNKEIKEVDLNPIIADKEGRLIGIDARIVLDY
ncbi:MAG: acetate--CoA ligase family protein [Clostridia bacterium]|nr:acetate--CoA ligase family protein [Clostridia bacterium]